MEYSVNNALNTHQKTFFVFLKVKSFNRAERYTLFALYGSILCCAYLESGIYISLYILKRVFIYWYSICEQHMQGTTLLFRLHVKFLC